MNGAVDHPFFNSVHSVIPSNFGGQPFAFPFSVLRAKLPHVRIDSHQCPRRQVAALLFSPMTGFYRDGYCRTGPGDYGLHTVCVEATAKFLAYSRAVGNDLSTPVPHYEFPAFNRAIAGAFASRGGRTRSKPAWRPTWCSAARISPRSSSFRWKICRPTP